MGPCFIDFRFEGPMTPFQFGKMGFYGHVLKFSSVRLVPDTRHTTPESHYFEAGFYAAKQQSPHCLNPLVNGKENRRDLNLKRQNRIIMAVAGLRAINRW